MKQSTHTELRDRAAACALGTLDDEERVEFEAHLLVCDECHDEFRSFDRVASALAHTVQPADPAPSIRGRIVEAAPASSSPRRSSVLMPWLAAAASLAVAAGVAAYAFTLRHVPDSPLFVVVMSADDLVRVDLAGQPAAPDARARAFWSRSRGMIFTASRLPALPSGRTYQLWIISGETPVGAGLLRPSPDGTVQAAFSTPPGLVTAAAFAVTIEPDGGVATPTGDKYLVGLVN